MLVLPVRLIKRIVLKHERQVAVSITSYVKGVHFIADRAYNSSSLIGQLQTKGFSVVIPRKSNIKNPREYDKHLYKEGHLV